MTTTIDTDDQAFDQALGLMTAGEVCARLRICRTTLSHLSALRPVKIGRAVRYRDDEVGEYLLDLARARDGRTGPGRPRSSDSL